MGNNAPDDFEMHIKGEIEDHAAKSEQIWADIKTQYEYVIHKCPQCAFTSSFYSIYNDHIQTNHASTSGSAEKSDEPADNTKYTCGTCQLSFVYKYSLLNHMRVHTEKPHKCDVCSKSFKYLKCLTSHVMKSHTEGQTIPYECTVCHMQFARKSYRTKHFIISHTVARPYRCFDCDKTFKLQEYLIRHITRKHIVK